MARKKKRPKKKTRRRWLLRILATAVVVVLLAGFFIWLTWPDVAALAHTPPRTTAFIDRAREQGTPVDWTWIPYGRISNDLKKAVVTAEDMSFYSHKGFDAHEIRVAARDAVRGKNVRGASTITQQLAKNLWLSPARSPGRKFREVVLTRQLEDHLDKRRILEIYLNVVQFGPGVFGAEAASRHYFGIPAVGLDRQQSAQLAAALPRPNSWHPGVESRGYRVSVNRILARMDQADWIDQLL